jgi:hypothetical protein
MPTPSTTPKRLQCVNRVATQLTAITAGATYWYTPRVYKRFYLPQELSDPVVYMVYTTPGGSTEHAGASGANTVYDEDFYITVHGCVRDSFDTTTMVEKAIHDVRTAIDADSIAKATSGALGYICVECRMEEPPEIDSTCLETMGIGLFDLKIRCKVTGTYAEL